MGRLPELQIGDIKAKLPIIQGGMGVRISLANLASAVANEGGVGTIACALIGGAMSHNSMDEHETADVHELTQQIRKAKSLTTGVLAVNVMVALTNYQSLVKTSAREGIDLVVCGAGLPLGLPKLVEGTKAKIAPVVSSGRAADIICRSWTRKYKRPPDLIIVEGSLAGGHLGFGFDEVEDKGKAPKLEDIVLDVIKVVKQYETRCNCRIPVVAAGGVYYGKDIAKYLKLGCSGAQLATRFACTHECDADDRFKQEYIRAKKEDIAIIKSPVGMPGRAIKNDFLIRAEKGEIEFDCDYQCLRPCVPSESIYCIADALTNAAKGELDKGFVFVGANAYRVDKMLHVKDLMKELVEDAEANL